MTKILKLILLSFLAFFVNYDSSKHFDKYYIPIDKLCMIRNVTGYPCPGCGMTRAHIEVLKLNFKKAFYYHPLFIFPSIIHISKYYFFCSDFSKKIENSKLYLS